MPSESEVSDEDIQDEYDEDDVGPAIKAMKNTGVGSEKNVCSTEAMSDEEYEWKDENDEDQNVMKEKNVRLIFCSY
jgi:hypothetical protein